MNLPEALATSCDTYFYDVGNRFYEGGSAARSRLQQWARKFGFGAPTGLDIGNEAPSWQTIVPTPAWRKKTFKSDWDKAWNPGDSIQLAIGQKDVTVTPLQMARFYAMIANGGKLVTPYVVSGVEQPGSNRQQPVTLQQFPPDPPRDAGVDPAALQAVREGLWTATHSTDGTSSGVFGTLPDLDRGQDGHGREGRQSSRLPGRAPRGSVVVVRLRALRRRRARRLRRDRERRPRIVGRSTGRAPRLREVLQPEGRRPGTGERRLIVDTRHRPPSLRSPSLGVFDVGASPAPARLAAAARRRDARRLRPLGDRRDHAVRRPRQSGLLRHAAGDRRRARRRRHARRDPRSRRRSTSVTGGSSTAARSA